MFGIGQNDRVKIILFSLNDDSYKYCDAFTHGFHIALHSPEELPRFPSDFIQIPMSYIIHMAIKPNRIATSNRLKSYSPQQRGCFFKTERHLRYFELYSQRKCELECLANYTKIECGCVEFWMPSKTFGFFFDCLLS